MEASDASASVASKRRRLSMRKAAEALHVVTSNYMRDQEEKEIGRIVEFLREHRERIPDVLACLFNVKAEPAVE
eukprot:9805280-Lingulodinium_polyedra.AAC.1